MLITAGCNYSASMEDGHETDALEPEQLDTVDPELNAKLGYVRYKADEVNQATEDKNEININRSQMADIITKAILRSENFQEVASLVTDKDVVIAYERNQEIDESTAADIASKTAASILPSFYEIHTTDNPTHMNDIHSLHLSTTDRQSDVDVIEKLIDSINEKNQNSNRR